jgi:transposase-like protein
MSLSKIYTDDTAARRHLERLLWPDGPVCPHCGVVNHAYKIKSPVGAYRCAEPACRKNFTVTMKTVMERSHIALHKWLQAFHLLTSSKKGISAHQLHRMMDISYVAAWFMAHRIRESMRSGGLAPLGREGKIVEADETYHGKTEEPTASPQGKGRPYKTNRGPRNKRPMLRLLGIAEACGSKAHGKIH